jgi:hypothetical protein
MFKKACVSVALASSLAGAQASTCITRFEFDTWESVSSAGSGALDCWPDGFQFSSGSTFTMSPTIPFEGVPIVAHVDVAAVPEPGTYVLMLAGLGLTACAARPRMA